MSFTLSVGLRKKLEIAFKRTGWTPEQVDRLCEGDVLSLIRQDFGGEARLLRPRAIVLTIIEGDGRTMPELIEEGMYTYVDEGFRNFVESSEFNAAAVKQEVEIVLLRFSRNVGINDVRNRITRMGLSSPTAEDAIRVGATYPGWGAGCTIIFPHRPWIDAGDACRLAALYCVGHHRMLTSCVYADTWPSGYIFAARAPRGMYLPNTSPG